MNKINFNNLVSETFAKTGRLLELKGTEYASSEDRLGNFKRGAQLAGITPLQIALVYLSKHYDAVATYVKNDASNMTMILSEPIEGRFHDIINYCYLMLALIAEKDGDLPNSRKTEPANPYTRPGASRVDPFIKHGYVDDPAKVKERARLGLGPLDDYPEGV